MNVVSSNMCESRMRSSVSSVPEDNTKEGLRKPMIKDEDLKDMDSLETGGGGWWASATGEVDYKYVTICSLLLCVHFVLFV